MSPKWLTPPPIRDLAHGFPETIGIGNFQVELPPEAMQRFQTRLGGWNSEIIAEDLLNLGPTATTSFALPTFSGGDTALDRIQFSLQITGFFSMIVFPSGGAPIVGNASMQFIVLLTNPAQDIYCPITALAGTVLSEYADTTTEDREWSSVQGEDWEEWATAELQDGAGGTWTIQLYIRPPLVGHGGLVTDWRPTSWAIFPTLYINGSIPNIEAIGDVGDIGDVGQIYDVGAIFGDAGVGGGGSSDFGALSPVGSLQTGSLNTGGLGAGGLSSGGLATGGIQTGGIQSGGLATGSIQGGGLSTGGIQSGGVHTGGITSGALSLGGLQSGGVASTGVTSGGLGTGALQTAKL